MKGKLSKSDIQYRLHNEEGIIIATSHDGKLSKQNCDEIFGVVDVKEVIAKNMLDHNIVDKAVDFSNANPENNGAYLAYIAGASEAFKAMELNKDKLFTVEDMQKLMYATIDLLEQNEGVPLKFFKEFLQSLQQPTEIEVEIVYRRACCADNFTCGNEDNCMICTQTFPKLDSNRCLILKRI